MLTDGRIKNRSPIATKGNGERLDRPNSRK